MEENGWLATAEWNVQGCDERLSADGNWKVGRGEVGALADETWMKRPDRRR